MRIYTSYIDDLGNLNSQSSKIQSGIHDSRTKSLLQVKIEIRETAESMQSQTVILFLFSPV